MKIKDLYEMAIQVGMDKDPRGRDALEGKLQRLAEEYEKLTGRSRILFDTGRLHNPFGDTRLICGDPERDIRRAVVGIDIDVAEICLAAALGSQNRPVDLVITHHPSAAGGLASAYDAGEPQIAMMVAAGVPAHKAEKLVKADFRSRDNSWHVRTMQAAEALGQNLISIHSPADICVYEHLQDCVARRQPEHLEDLIDICDEWPECRWLMERMHRGPEIVVGEASDPIDKLYTVFYGGWNPTPACIEALCEAGVGTFLLMATSEQFNEIARRYHASVVVVPHYPADNVGLNLLLDMVPPDDRFEIIEVSNFVRVTR